LLAQAQGMALALVQGGNGLWVSGDGHEKGGLTQTILVALTLQVVIA
jgi:hypothetical protein